MSTACRYTMTKMFTCKKPDYCEKSAWGGKSGEHVSHDDDDVDVTGYWGYTWGYFPVQMSPKTWLYNGAVNLSVFSRDLSEYTEV